MSMSCVASLRDAARCKRATQDDAARIRAQTALRAVAQDDGMQRTGAKSKDWERGWGEGQRRFTQYLTLQQPCR